MNGVMSGYVEEKDGLAVVLGASGGIGRLFVAGWGQFQRTFGPFPVTPLADAL